MSIDLFPASLEMELSSPSFATYLTLPSAERLKFEIKRGPFARIETVDIRKEERLMCNF